MRRPHEHCCPHGRYPCNRHFVRLLEGVPRAIAIDAASGFQPIVEKVGAGWTAKTRGLPGLRKLGFRIDVEPQGAFYIYADIGNLGKDSFTLAEQLLERAGVAATPGLDFGSNAPARHMRFAYTVDREKLDGGAGATGALFQRIAPQFA